MSKEQKLEAGSTNASMNTELKPTPVDAATIPPPCTLCKWFEKRLTSTLKEQIKHMEKFHLS